MTPRGSLSLPPPTIQLGARKKTTFSFGSWSAFRVHLARIGRPFGTSSLDVPSETLDDAADGGSRWVEDASGEAYRSGPQAWNNVGGSETEPDEVDVVVVDNVFAGNTTPKLRVNPTHSEKGAQVVESTSHPHTDNLSTTNTTVRDRHVFLTTVRWRIVRFFSRFNSQAFLDPVAENQYQRETWFSNKPLAIFGSLWLVMNWVLACGLLPRPLVTFDKAFLFGFGPVLSLPVPFFAIFDLPRKKTIFYQCYLIVSVWSWPFAGALYMNLCGFYGSHSFWSCGTKDFVGSVYFSTALPTIALFACGMWRLPALVASIAFVCTISAIIAPGHGAFIREIINILVFNMFILYIHYIREQSERRLFTVRDQVKLQYRATQKAQISERRAADSTRRLTSYIFHEVRVPLNTAMLALQNLEASLPPEDDQAVEFGALSTSLLLLSDILDFNRMDTGRFESVSKPFSFHRMIRSSMVGLKMAADAKGVKFITEFDREIDLAARAAAYRERGKSEQWIAWQLGCNADEDAYVLGDEMRLIQVVTNLTSNACKFTPPGPENSVIVRTKLLHPPAISTLLSGPTAVSTDNTSMPSTQFEREDVSTAQLSHHNLSEPKDSYGQSPPVQQLIVRIEVQDTGVGIRPRDMIDNRLFSPYVQTEIGRHQGGKGTGLGLALVRHIVNLSGGRLGVRSKKGHGSCFWIEFPLGIAPLSFEPEAVMSTLSPLPAVQLHQALTPFDLKTAREGQALVSYISPGVGFNHMPPTPPSPSHVGSNPQRKSCNGSTILSATSEISTVPIHVLVVDDDQLTRKLMVRMLQRIGCTVETAENGQKALELITEERQESPSAGGRPKIRIVFLDNQMPILSGVGLCKELRRRGRRDFVVGITGNALKEDQLEFTQAGADKVLIKPVLERSLREMLNLALGLSDS